MTLEVYNTNSGIPMGKAQLGGGGAESDGALYQYMGSVATYAALELLDTTDFKPGYVYDVQEDGMDYAWTGEAWNALGTHTDLSNYYTKTEVDALIPDVSTLATKSEVAKKQDKMVIDLPLSLSEVTSGAAGVEISGTRFRQTTFATKLGFPQYSQSTSVSAPTLGGVRKLGSDQFFYTGDVKGVTIKAAVGSPRDTYEQATILIGNLNPDTMYFTPRILVTGACSSSSRSESTPYIGFFGSATVSGTNTNKTTYTVSDVIYRTYQWYSSYYQSGHIANVSVSFSESNGYLVANAVFKHSGVTGNLSLGITTTMSYADADLNCVLFNQQKSSSWYTISDNGVFDKTTGEQVWKAGEQSSVSSLHLNIGAGLAAQGGNLVNTNPTPVDVSNKVTGVGISEMQALTQTEYDEIGKYYAYEYNGTTVYVRKETPTTTDTVYSAIDTASALTITSVGTDSLTLSDGNTYTRSAASDEIDGTQYDATTLYVVKNVVGE